MQDDIMLVQKMPYILFIETKIIWSWSFYIWVCTSTKIPLAIPLTNLQVTKLLFFVWISAFSTYILYNFFQIPDMMFVHQLAAMIN